ncbi:MAG TPA: hypothetical protein DC001_00885 [Clostridiales bacterium]|nr:hypothetical protein [Clostridiales bacterium]
MWISEKMARTGEGAGSRPALGEITIGGAPAAAYWDGESRNMPVVSSGGVIWRPAGGQRGLVIECEGGQRVVAGAVQEAGRPDLENGEVLIESGAASIRLKNSGEILIKGRVNIEGELTVGGVPIG